MPMAACRRGMRGRGARDVCDVLEEGARALRAGESAIFGQQIEFWHASSPSQGAFTITEFIDLGFSQMRISFLG